MSSEVESRDKRPAARVSARRYWKLLRECFGLVLVGVILFSVLDFLSNGCGEHVAEIKKELSAHRDVFMALSQQAAGIATAFCGVFFITCGSQNSRFFAKYFCIPFIGFIRDGAAIAVGGFLFEKMKLNWNNRQFDGLWSELGMWSACVASATALLCIMLAIQAKNPRSIKFNWGAVLAGATLVVVGFRLTFA